jgi:hypothetical protein
MDQRLEIATRFIAGFIAAGSEDVDFPESQYIENISIKALKFADVLIAEHNKTK